jgi:hypothetical protein
MRHGYVFLPCSERRLAQEEQAEQEQVDLLAPEHTPIGQSVNGGRISISNPR